MSRLPLLAIALAAVLASPLPAVSASEIPRFVDETGVAGIEHRYEGDDAYMVGGGVAAFDCDGDDLPELFLAGGGAPSHLFLNRSRPNGPLRFEEAPASGIVADGNVGAYPLDIDGDGTIDLVVLRQGENVLYRGSGKCRFERANEIWKFDGGNEWTTAFSATWENDRSWPTLVFGNYIDRTRYRANQFACHDHQIFRPDPAGAFAPAQNLAPGYCALSILFSDWNRRGVMDLRVSNDKDYFDTGHEQLWRFDPGAAPREYVAADGMEKIRINGMGIASHDVTGNGMPEYFLTNMGANPLLSLLGDGAKPEYRDIADRVGVSTPRPEGVSGSRPSTAWHAEFQDVNNDGLIDLFVAKGNVGDLPRFARRDPNALLVQNVDGTFADIADQAGVASVRRGRGATVVDLNADGMLDVVVVNRWDRAEIWRNVGRGTAESPEPIGNWLAVRLEGKGGNRFGVGAWIEMRTDGHVQRREITVGGGHAGGQLGWAHFGLGGHDSTEVRVLWPGRRASPWTKQAANRRIVVVQE